MKWPQHHWPEGLPSNRSIDVDVAVFRSITSGKNIMSLPCLDDQHATDGYEFPSIEFFHGVFWQLVMARREQRHDFNW